MTVSERPTHGTRLLGLFRGMDPIFGGAAILLILYGLLGLYSISAAMPEEGIFRRHLLVLAIGLVPFLIFWLMPPMLWQRLSAALYTFNLMALGFVLVGGASRGGAQRWIEVGPVQLQPSEFSKLLCVITLATYFAKRQDVIKSPWVFLGSLVHILPPMILIFRQPHLGATLTLMATWLAICVVARVPWRTLGIFFGTLALLGAVIGPTVLRGYQEDRLRAFTDRRSRDLTDEGYQQLRAEVAIGVGGLAGTGFLRGEQKASRAVPEQHNDFAFTILAEEFGLTGTMFLLATFAVFFLRGWALGARMGEPFARMVVLGSLTVLAFHWVVNLAMNLNIGPVVGLWLPFISAGGTALWLCVSVVAIILAFNARNVEDMFRRGSPTAWAEQDTSRLR